MKKNKIISYFLAGSIILGGGFIGTKALFSDKAVSNNSLTLTTGKVDIDTHAYTWYRNPKDINGDGIIDARDRIDEQVDIEKSDEGNFENIQPGDVFVRYIDVWNQKSTYDVDLKISENKEIKVNGSEKDLGKYIDITNTLPSEIKAHTNTGGYLTVKIDNSEDAWRDFNGAGTININEVYDITATQK